MRAVPPYLLRFGRVTLNRLYLREGFISRTCRLGDSILHTGARLPQSASEDEGGPDDNRNYGKSRRGEPAVGDSEQNDSTDQKECLARKLGEIVAEDRLQHRRVGRKAARQLSRPPFSEKSWRQPHEMREQIFAQPGDDEL